MTWGNPPPIVPTKPKPGKVITPEDLAASGSEDGHQSAVFCWAAMNVGKYPPLKWLHAIPNGGSRHIAEATKMVAAGTRSGVWDMFLPCIKLGFTGQYLYHGCYIEMKKPSKRNHKNSGLSDDQIEFGKYAIETGYYCAVCYSWEEAMDVLVNYLEGKI